MALYCCTDLRLNICVSFYGLCSPRGIMTPRTLFPLPSPSYCFQSKTRAPRTSKSLSVPSFTGEWKSSPFISALPTSITLHRDCSVSLIARDDEGPCALAVLILEFCLPVRIQNISYGGLGMKSAGFLYFPEDSLQIGPYFRLKKTAQLI